MDAFVFSNTFFISKKKLLSSICLPFVFQKNKKSRFYRDYFTTGASDGNIHGVFLSFHLFLFSRYYRMFLSLFGSLVSPVFVYL